MRVLKNYAPVLTQGFGVNGHLGLDIVGKGVSYNVLDTIATNERWLQTEDLPNEVWKDIKNYEGIYQASNYGRIKSLERKSWNRFSFILKQEHILKKRYCPKGYVKYCLYKDSKKRDFKGHFLILSTFFKNKLNKPQINHINGIKDDNRLENLEWCNNSENQLHAYRYGLKKAKTGSNHPSAVKVNQYDLQNNFIRTWGSIVEASENLNICRSKISSVCRSNRKTTGGYIWKYSEVKK